jgi:hypothetical protein
VKAFAPGEPFILNAGEIMRALQRPPSQARLEAAVDHEVWPAIDPHLHFIDQAFARALQEKD